MHPTLLPLHIGDLDLSLRSYGAMMALGFLVSVWLAVRAARRAGLDPQIMLDLAVRLLPAALIGSRVLYVLVHAREYALACYAPARFNALLQPAQPLTGPDCMAVLRLWEGGLVWYGAFAGGLLAAALFCRARGVSLARVADLATPGGALGHALGRVGCFLAGCCWGKPCAGAWGARFPAGGLAWLEQRAEGVIEGWAESTLPVHPTQLYEAGGELILLFVLLALRRRQRFDGQIVGTWALGYALLRCGVEVFRADSARGALLRWGPAPVLRWLSLPAGSWILLSTSQAIALIAAAAAAAWLVRGLRESPR